MSTSSMAFQLGASSSLSFSSSSIPRWTHDVFLSFRGADVRQNFISHLYHALHQRGANTYMDDNLEKGEEISPELFKAIEGSMVSIVVLSKNYSDSRWCLDELLKIIECKEKLKQIHVLPLFYDVDPSDVGHQKGSFGEAFSRVEHKFKADEVKLTKWKAALEEVANLSGFELGDRNESEFIQDIIRWVDSKMVDCTPLNVAKNPVGIESRVQDIYQHLNMGRNDIICMVGIFGTGGIGKTTILKAIYNKIFYQFEGSCFLNNIRETSKAGGLIQLQKSLLYDILGIRLECHDRDKGINIIRHRLCSKRVLLILDDVDDLVQLETLARDWFGPGSRIIITTRDQHLLNISKVDSKYEVKRLDHNEALELFSWHAFEEDKPIEDYVELSKQVMQYGEGLPLALTVVGLDLKVQNINHWRSTLDKYKQIPNKNIQEALCISYDGLDDNEKNIFLDIACFLKGQCLDHVIKILDSCGFSSENGIQRLVDKCLVTITTCNTLWMHDLLQDMGREIVRKECEDPGTRSRLWVYEEARYVLEENAGTNNVVGINVDPPILLGGNDHDRIRLRPKAFAKMKRLRFFISRRARFFGRVLSLPNELRVLDWSNCPFESFPSNFCGKKLVVLKMYEGRIKEISGQFKLDGMEFSGCKFLTKITDLSSCSNLKELSISKCKNLVEVHDSVGFLDKLVHLSLRNCCNLKSFPRHLKLRSLEVFELTYCKKLLNFPEMECKMERLSRMALDGTAINELPASVGYFSPALNCLSLMSCTKLMRLPSSIHQLQNLKVLCLNDCINLGMGEVASSINGCFTGIENLNIEGCMHLMRLPINVSHLQDLKILYLDDYTNLAIEEIFSSIGYLTGLKELHLTASRTMRSEQESSAEYLIRNMFIRRYLDVFSFYCSSTLRVLDLSRSAYIVSLPPSIIEFVELRILTLWKCEKLEEILHLPPNIQELDASECFSLKRFPEVSTKCQFNTSCGLRELRWIDLSGCHKLVANIGSQEPDPSFVEEHIQDHSCGIIFPGNEIPDWFGYIKKTSNSDSCELDIIGPLNLDEIIGIVFCAVLESNSYESSGICVSINGNMLVENFFYFDGNWDHVYLNYSFRECMEQWLRYPTGDYLRFRFYCDEEAPVMFKSCGVHIIYKHEENENLTVGECSVGSSNGLNRIGHEGGFETFGFGSTSGAQTNNRSEASSSISSFSEAIWKQDSEMLAEFPYILDGSFDYWLL